MPSALKKYVVVAVAQNFVPIAGVQISTKCLGATSGIAVVTLQAVKPE